MKTLQLCIIAIIAMTVQSCLEPDPINEDEMLLEEALVTEVSSENEDSSEDEAPAVEVAVTLEGLWTSTSVLATGTITTINNGASPATETVDFYGVGYDFNHTVSFLDLPNIAIGEGIYSLSLEMTGGTDGDNTQEIVGLTLISSQTFWTQEGDQLTINAGGKIRTATITELTENALTLYFEEASEVTSQGGTIVENTVKNTTYEFVK